MFDAEIASKGVLRPGESLSRGAAFPIVGVGASTGGLEAFTQLLKYLPKAIGMAYVFVQYLDSSHRSILPDLLARVTRMPVCIVQDRVTVEADHVYVIPSNVDVVLEQGMLHLLLRAQHGGQHFTIDRFFHSLAVDWKHQAIGVLLSGTASDGTAGLQSIKARGGMTFAQNEQSAYPQMPQHAIAAECVDRILPLEEIARALIALGNHPYFTASLLMEPHALSSAELQALKEICLLLSRVTDVDLLTYRPAPLQRCIIRRMAVVQVDDLCTYATYLEGHPAEVEALSQEVLLHVTSFFRDPGTFEMMTRLVFPTLVRHLLPVNPIRIWVVGCSTGEEVYSLAISLLEFLELHTLPFTFQLFATDIDAVALKQARAGIYHRKTLRGVSPQRLERFFLPLDRKGEKYQIGKAIRECCVFAQQNVSQDPPFSRLDLISCRNVLICLPPAEQEKVLLTLHYALNSYGFLVLGTSESVGLDSTLFSRMEPHQKLFTKKSCKRNFSVSMAIDNEERARESREENVKKYVIHEYNAQQEADHLLLTTYAPASVVIDADMQILHIRGRTGSYLEPAPGKANFHILKWAREGLKLGLRTAIHAARQENHPISRDGLQVSGTKRWVRITVVPLKGSSMMRCFLVLFEEETDITLEAVAVSASSPFQFGKRSKRAVAAAWIAALEQELATTQKDVQAMLEERDKTDEHLQAANEETRSSNEELQSINEELETSQTELQASNEELTTVNQELQTRNEQLREAQDYAESIVETIREPLVVLSADLQLQRANTAFYQFFKVTPPQLEHHSLAELGNGQWDLPELHRLLEQVWIKNQSFHGFEVEHLFPHIGYKIMLLSARSIVNERQGTQDHLILLAMEDITARRELELQKETFIGMVGHELKTPLTAVKGSIQLLQRRVKKAGDESTAAELGMVDVHLNKLADLINSLLDASALEAGAFSIRPLPFAIDDLVREIIQQCAHTSLERLHFEESVPAMAYGDRERTGQVILNLLTNALKYSAPTDPVRVRISTSEYMLTLSVQDCGVGIPLDLQERIFERFARVSLPEQAGVPGMGLGLYIAAQIVTHQGGKIWLKSSPGKGSTFFFTLPLAPQSAADKV